MIIYNCEKHKQVLDLVINLNWSETVKIVYERNMYIWQLRHWISSIRTLYKSDGSQLMPLQDDSSLNKGISETEFYKSELQNKGTYINSMFN